MTRPSPDVEVEADRGFFHRAQIAQGSGVDAQRGAHGLAVQAGNARQQLLVDADRQRQAVAESRELLL